MNKVFSFAFGVVLASLSNFAMAEYMSCESIFNGYNYDKKDKLLSMLDCRNDNYRLCYTSYISGYHGQESIRITGQFDYHYYQLHIKRYNSVRGEVFEDSKTISMYAIEAPQPSEEPLHAYFFELDKSSNAATAIIKKVKPGLFSDSWENYQVEKLDCEEMKVGNN